MFRLGLVLFGWVLFQPFAAWWASLAGIKSAEVLHRFPVATENEYEDLRIRLAIFVFVFAKSSRRFYAKKYEARTLGILQYPGP